MTVTHRVNDCEPGQPDANDDEDMLPLFSGELVAEPELWSTRFKRVCSDLLGIVVLAAVVLGGTTVLAMLIWWLWCVISRSIADTPLPPTPVTPPGIGGDQIGF